MTISLHWRGTDEASMSLRCYLGAGEPLQHGKRTFLDACCSTAMFWLVWKRQRPRRGRAFHPRAARAGFSVNVRAPLCNCSVANVKIAEVLKCASRHTVASFLPAKYEYSIEDQISGDREGSSAVSSPFVKSKTLQNTCSAKAMKEHFASWLCLDWVAASGCPQWFLRAREPTHTTLPKTSDCINWEIFRC